MRIIKAFFMLGVVLITASFGVPNTSNGYKIGDVATDFSLINVDGSLISLSDYDTAKGFIVIFTCNSCPFSIAYEDRIIALDKKFKSQGFPVIAINPNNPKKSPSDDFSSMKKRAIDKGFTFPYLFDDGQNVYPKYGATRTPHVFVLKKEDTALIVAYIGTIDDNARNASAVKSKYVEIVVNELLLGKKPSITQTKAIGCSIKK